MALDAQTTFAAAPQKVPVHGPRVGVMAGFAGHGAAVTGIGSLVTHRVRELCVALMAVGACVAIVFEHAGIVRAVEVVAVGAVVPARMLVQHSIPRVKGRAVAITTDGADIGREKPLTVAGVRVVTGRAGVAGAGDAEVAVNVVE